MLFSTGTFIFLFVPVSLLGYQLASRFGRPAMLAWLTAASLFFYGYWNPRYLALLCGSILMNFCFARRIALRRSDKEGNCWLAAAIACDLLLLAYYKYLFPVLGFLHGHGLVQHEFSSLVLPLGISFFTFTQIAYLVDLREGGANLQELLPYSVFVTFFPHLIAGPIIHPREVMPQLERGRIHGLRVDDVALGLSWFLLGLAKKVLIADRVAPLADVLYAHPRSAGMSTCWLGALAYGMQLYFDFSGYSDMAVGLARMFSIRFPFNFNSPLKAQGVIEFWHRWHMTLSRYLNEYLATPITRWIVNRRLDAGKKISRKATATLEGYFSMVFTPLMLTMFLCGIWHGAGLQFVLWGVIQGIFLCVNHAWRIWTPPGHPLHRKVPPAVMIAVNLLCYVTSEVFFRAASLRDAFYVAGTMLGLHGRGASFAAFPFFAEVPPTSVFLTHATTAMAALGVCLFIVWAMPNTQEILGQQEDDRSGSLLPNLRWTPSLAWSCGLTALFCLTILMLDASKRFLYFQF